MTNQHTTKQSQRPLHREDYKVQKLIERIETKMSFQLKVTKEAQARPKN